MGANSGVTLASFTPVGPSNFDSNNQLQIQGSDYDEAGNQKVIGGFTFAYDGENRLAQSTLNDASASYSYDGEGRRVKKVSGSRTVVYVYGVGGDLIQEYDTATPAETGRQYLAQDMLGSTRVVFSGSGTAVRCMDYLPFGEQIPQGVGAGRSGDCWVGREEPRQKSTGKERDVESGLDYFGARYLSSAQGRFTSPDPIQITTDRLMTPQRLNLYAYAVDNPLANIDPDGRDAIAVVFPDYRITALGTKWSQLGHAGVITLDSKGHTRYFDYGRYPGSNKDAAPGRVREFDVLDVRMGADGRPTPASMKMLMNDVSRKAGQGGKVEGAYFDTNDQQTRDMNKHALTIQSENEKSGKKAYGLIDNNCGTFVNDTLKVGAQKVPMIIDPRPNSMIDEWKGKSSQVIDYDPNKNK